MTLIHESIGLLFGWLVGLFGWFDGSMIRWPVGWLTG